MCVGKWPSQWSALKMSATHNRYSYSCISALVTKMMNRLISVAFDRENVFYSKQKRLNYKIKKKNNALFPKHNTKKYSITMTQKSAGSLTRTRRRLHHPVCMHRGSSPNNKRLPPYITRTVREGVFTADMM